MHRLLFLGALALVTGFVAFPAARAVEASTVRKLDLEGLVEHAELVLEARVLGAEPGLDEHGRIVTRYTLAVARTLRGAHEAVRTMSVPGGVLPNGRGLVIPGLPVLAAGEEALLFLTSESRAGVRLPVGLSQGRLRVARAANGAKRFVREHGAVEFVDAAGHTVPAPTAVETFDYAATIARVEAACAARAERERAGGRR
ncbi:MAG: hypothetical protein HZA53_11225 [Planctomycetes bacterium]|nr:hypothetical protein [Planctomycetota bacterium]